MEAAYLRAWNVDCIALSMIARSFPDKVLKGGGGEIVSST